ncbi:unnamed protein product [Urochloa humidicola]
MFGRVSPRISMMHAASIQKKLSPKSSVNMRRKGSSPKVASTQKKKNGSPKVDTRAHWNAGLEKALVELLHEHNNDCYRGQNGWSSEAWNRICKLFNEKFSNIKFSKVQIQDKEKELKRDYKLLKQAKGQSGSHWNEKLCRIEASPPIWANIIVSFPKAKKFQNKSFPLFDALGELYDGHTTEGNLSFTSVDPSLTDLTQGNGMQEEETENSPFGPPLNGASPDRRHAVQHIDDEEEELTILDQPSAASSAADIRGKRVASSRNKDSSASGEKADRVGHKRKQDGVVVEMMGRFLEKREKQAEAKNAFSLPVCISVVDGMEDLSDDEKVEAYDVFKDEQNRFIFMTANESRRIKWLRKKIQRQG